MRWDGQRTAGADDGALPGLERRDRWQESARTVRSPEFAGITFHEVLTRSALTRQPAGSAIPVRWTINPYRGCSHACVYCFARRTHSYLELDTGHDFDTQIVVKTNIGAVLRRELARPSWRGELVALGTNTDPYQRAEGRYRLMPEIIGALSDARTPISLLTKGTMLTRDLDLFVAADQRAPVGLSVSLGILDPALHASLEPGTPTPAARLRMIRAIREAGLSCGVLVAPVIPLLTDSAEQLRATVHAVVDAGATSVSGLPLRLMPGAREWFLAWLERERPDLVASYERLYRLGADPDPAYADRLRRRLEAVVAGSALGSSRRAEPWRGLVQGDERAARADDEPRLF